MDRIELERYVEELADGVLDSSRVALAKIISLMENEPGMDSVAIKRLERSSWPAYVVGVTGPPGAGKSSLVTKMIKGYIEKGQTVGVVAVDPTSPFTGGAILGDRFRMSEIEKHDGVFIRSLATRGAMGGLSAACNCTVKAMAAFGFDVIIIETVGVGQDEIDIIKSCDACVLVMMPGAGDDIQLLKAGIMEIADIFVVNKADLIGADRVATGVKLMLEHSTIEYEWKPPVLKTASLLNEGIDSLLNSIEQFRSFQVARNLLDERRKKRIKREIISLIERALFYEIDRRIHRRYEFDQTAEDVLNRKITSYSVADEMIDSFLKE